MEQKTYNLYYSLLGLLIKNGKKIKARKILDSALILTCKKCKISIINIIILIFRNMYMLTATRLVRFRKKTNIIPHTLNKKRRYYQIAKIIMEAISKNKSRKNTAEKLSQEFINILQKNKCYSLSKKKDFEEKSKRFKTYAHFRW